MFVIKYLIREVLFKSVKCQWGSCSQPRGASNCAICSDVLIAYSFFLNDKRSPRNMKSTTWQRSQPHRKVAPSNKLIESDSFACRTSEETAHHLDSDMEVAASYAAYQRFLSVNYTSHFLPASYDLLIRLIRMAFDSMVEALLLPRTKPEKQRNRRRIFQNISSTRTAIQVCTCSYILRQKLASEQSQIKVGA